jgi:hypothetical protein
MIDEDVSADEKCKAWCGRNVKAGMCMAGKRLAGKSFYMEYSK